MDRLFVQFLVVLDGLEFSVFLLYEEKWRGIWGT